MAPRFNAGYGPPPQYGGPTPAVVMPQTSAPTIPSLGAPKAAEGGPDEEISMYMNNFDVCAAYKEHKEIRLTPGSEVNCSLEVCTSMLSTGPSNKYCTVCGANQEIEETKKLKVVLNKN